MSLKNQQNFTNNTGYGKRNNKLKDKQINISTLENLNSTPVSELPINTDVGPSEYSATHV